jgi:hypothetical protein
MTKQLLIAIAAAALAPSAVFSQTSVTGPAFQQSGWLPAAPSAVVGAQTGPVLGRPLSATEVRHTQQTLSDGSHVNSSETTQFYRDIQGRMLLETSTGAVIYDPVAGFTYDLTKRNKTYTKSATSPGSTVAIAAAAHQSWTSSVSPSPSGVKTARKSGAEPVTEDLPPQSLNGIYVKGSRVTVTIPAGTFGNDRDLSVINERWVSDDLKLLVKSSNTDPRFGVTTYELTNITQAPPDPALFQVPADYALEVHHE